MSITFSIEQTVQTGKNHQNRPYYFEADSKNFHIELSERVRIALKYYAEKCRKELMIMYFPIVIMK